MPFEAMRVGVGVGGWGVGGGGVSPNEQHSEQLSSKETFITLLLSLAAVASWDQRRVAT